VKVIYFLVHKFLDVEGMLAYVQTYHFMDHSRERGCAQENKPNYSAQRKIDGASALDEGVGIMKTVDKEYLIVRGQILFDAEEDNTSQQNA
jgi:hypothetical protein